MSDTNHNPTTEEIIAKARELGTMISNHTASTAYHEAMNSLENDVEAQRILTDYKRKAQALSEKEAKGQPIEVEEKHALHDLQSAMAMNPVLSKIQIVQMDYLDLMRKVEQAMAQAAGEDGQTATQTTQTTT